MSVHRQPSGENLARLSVSLQASFIASGITLVVGTWATLVARQHRPGQAALSRSATRSATANRSRRHRPSLEPIETWLVERSLAGAESCQLSGVDVRDCPINGGSDPGIG